MFRIEKLSTLGILAILSINPAFAADKSAAMVNGVSIPQSRIDMRVQTAGAQGQPDSPELRKAVREDLINLEVLSQTAIKLGLDKDAEVKAQIEIAKQSILAGAFVQNFAKRNPISDELLKKEYDNLKVSVGSKEYKARHILVETETEAKDIISQLGKKAKFEKLAAKSKDVGSAEKGGQLDWAVPSNYVAPFSNAMTTLKKGEYTKEPVQSQYGWHVIQLDDIRDLKVPPFEELKGQLQQRMQQQNVQKEVAELRAKSKIE